MLNTDKKCCWKYEECNERRGNKTRSYCKKHTTQYEMMRNYDLSWDKLLELQAVENCESCGKPLLGQQKHIDHSHITGKVRGVLCWPCNSLAGKIESKNGDNVIKYLKRTNENKYKR